MALCLKVWETPEQTAKPGVDHIYVAHGLILAICPTKDADVCAIMTSRKVGALDMFYGLTSHLISQGVIDKPAPDPRSRPPMGRPEAPKWRGT